MGGADIGLPVTVWPLVAIGVTLPVVAIAEYYFADRTAQRARWWANFGLGALNAVLVRMMGIAAPAGVAVSAEKWGFGLFNQITVPAWAAVVAAVLLMDFAIYWQHRALHATRAGWALHRLHHADAAMDVSTAVRFHPGEALVSMLYKSALTALLGLPLAAVLAFEAWLAIGSIFEHANLRLSPRADAIIRRWWVTPAMHRVHHSAHGDDHNHNYGFAIAIWDRMFGTYRPTPSGQEIGLPLGRAAG